MIHAISTRYKGYNFRSRLEARWAVFFDALGIKWEYEKEGFDIGGVCYLPDFWLPEVKMWAEVKPEEFNDEEELKAVLLCNASKFPVLKLIGTPDNKPYRAVELPLSEEVLQFGGRINNALDYNNQIIEWVEEIYCLTNYKSYPKTEGRFYCSPGGEYDSHFEDTAWAMLAARSARFEFGGSYG